MRRSTINASDLAKAMVQFRWRLLRRLFRRDPVHAWSRDERRWFMARLEAVWTPGSSAPDTPRIRALEKTASNAKRLLQSLGQLSMKDQETLDIHYRGLLKARMGSLHDLAVDASALAAGARGENKANQQLQRQLNADRLVGLLLQFQLPVTTLHNYSSNKAESNGYAMPSLESPATLAMDCAMLAMQAAGVDGLDWGKTVSALEEGRLHFERYESDFPPPNTMASWVDARSRDALRLSMQTEPVWSTLVLPSAGGAQQGIDGDGAGAV